MSEYLTVFELFSQMYRVFARRSSVVKFTVPEHCALSDSVFDDRNRNASTARDNTNRFFHNNSKLFTFFFLSYSTYTFSQWAQNRRAQCDTCIGYIVMG